MRSNSDQFAAIEINWANAAGPIAGLYLIFALVTLVNGLWLVATLAAFRLNLAASEWLPLTIVTQAANYLLPVRGGAGLRAAYLVRYHRLPLGRFLVAFSVLVPMQMVTNAILALLGMAAVAATTGVYDPVAAAFAVMVVATGLAVFRVRYRPKRERQEFPWRQLQRLAAGWETVRGDRRLVSRLWALTLIFTLLTVAQVKLAFMACGRDLAWQAVGVYAAGKNLAALASVTPGALGIVEALSIYLGRVLDYTPAQALVVQGLIRGVAISSLALLAPFAYLALRSHLEVADADPVSDL